MSGNEFPPGSNIILPFSVCFFTAPQAGGEQRKTGPALFYFDLTRFDLQFCKATPPSFGRIVVEGTVAHNRAIQYVICIHMYLRNLYDCLKKKKTRALIVPVGEGADDEF